MLKLRANSQPDSSVFRGVFLRGAADMPLHLVHPIRNGCPIAYIEHGNHTEPATKRHTETAENGGENENYCP